MKRKLAAALLALISGVIFVGCDMEEVGKIPDYNADVQTVAPENITVEHFVAEENTTYYTSQGLSLWMEVNGAYLKMDYFSLDGKKRVYDNLYFYEDDYFYMVTGDSRELYAALSDSVDEEYAEEEKQDGYEVQINVKKSGIYKLIFDTAALEFSMEYKAEIQTPVYYTIKDCDILSGKNSWLELSVNSANEEEFVAKDIKLSAGETVGFYSHLHTSHYKVSLEEGSRDRYAALQGKFIKLNVGGTYNLYINRKTYAVRLELLNPDTASYSCVYYDGKDFIELSPYDTALPYIFRQRITVETKYTTSLPKFHTANYRTYDLTVVDTADLLMGSGKNRYFKEAGVYDIVINLKTFEITAERLPE